MLQASLPECSQEAYRGFTGSHLLALNTLAKHIHLIVSYPLLYDRAVARALMGEQWKGD